MVWKHCSCRRDAKESIKDMRCKCMAVGAGEEKRGEARHTWMLVEGGEMDGEMEANLDEGRRQRATACIGNRWPTCRAAQRRLDAGTRGLVRGF